MSIEFRTLRCSWLNFQFVICFQCLLTDACVNGLPVVGCHVVCRQAIPAFCASSARYFFLPRFSLCFSGLATSFLVLCMRSILLLLMLVLAHHALQIRSRGWCNA